MPKFLRAAGFLAPAPAPVFKREERTVVESARTRALNRVSAAFEALNGTGADKLVLDRSELETFLEGLLDEAEVPESWKRNPPPCLSSGKPEDIPVQKGSHTIPCPAPPETLLRVQRDGGIEFLSHQVRGRLIDGKGSMVITVGGEAVWTDDAARAGEAAAALARLVASLGARADRAESTREDQEAKIRDLDQRLNAAVGLSADCLSACANLDREFRGARLESPARARWREALAERADLHLVESIYAANLPEGALRAELEAQTGGEPRVTRPLWITLESEFLREIISCLSGSRAPSKYAADPMGRSG